MTRRRSSLSFVHRPTHPHTPAPTHNSLHAPAPPPMKHTLTRAYASLYLQLCCNNPEHQPNRTPTRTGNARRRSPGDTTTRYTALIGPPSPGAATSPLGRATMASGSSRSRRGAGRERRGRFHSMVSSCRVCMRRRMTQTSTVSGGIRQSWYVLWIATRTHKYSYANQHALTSTH